MADRGRLTWGCVIATKDRHDILVSCVECALQQTRPPAEIIIVDATPTWQDGRDAVAAAMANHPVRLVYEPAAITSTAVQRNDGVAQAKADICFLIDDDSLLYPDAAEHVLEVYERDAGQAVLGVGIVDAQKPAPKQVIEVDRKERAQIPTGKAAPGPLRRFLRWARRSVFLMDHRTSFTPYDGAFHTPDLAPEIAEVARPAILLDGFGMTMRRSAIEAEPFEPSLRYYCAMEDLDTSYRVSRRGALVTSKRARLFHVVAGGGRISRFTYGAIVMGNQTTLLALNVPERARARRLILAQALRRLLAEGLKDLFSRRFGLPQMRGAFYGMRKCVGFTRLSAKEIRARYPAMQDDFLRAGAS